MRCYGCGDDKDLKTLAVYPYPDDEILCDDPIEPLLVAEIQGEADRGDYRAAVYCHECFHRIETECGGHDVWLGQNQWEGLTPLVPFADLPAILNHPDAKVGQPEYDRKWSAESYPPLIKARGEPMNLFQSGDFTLSSGKKSAWKLECDSLTDADIVTLAAMIRQLVGPFGSVEGVPRGGLRLAHALCEFAKPTASGSHLIVDDVLTTGASMERALDRRKGGSLGVTLGGVPYVGAVVFARGPCPSWVKALFQMPKELWV